MFVKEPSDSVVIQNHINENIRSTDNNVDQGSSCDFELNNRRSDKSKLGNKKGAVGSSNKTKVSKSWPVSPDSKMCGGPPLKSSSSWTSQFPIWPKSRQQASFTSPHILTTSKHSETKSRLHTSSISFPCSAHFSQRVPPPYLKSSVPKIMISTPSKD